MVIKRLNNADPGDADRAGGDDWDQVSDLINLGYTDALPLKLKSTTSGFTGTVQNPDFTANLKCEPFYSTPTYIVYQDSRDSLFKVKTGRRGQVENESVKPEDAINYAIGTTVNNSYIEIRSGTYDLSGSFSGFTALGTNVYINATRAAINVPAGYTGYVWTVTPSANPFVRSIIRGGLYSQQAGSSPRLWTCIDLHSTLFTGQVNGCKFVDMDITNSGTAIALRTDWNTVNGGVINGNLFNDIRIQNTNIGVAFIHTGTYTDALTGSNRNRFTNVLYESFSSLY